MPRDSNGVYSLPAGNPVVTLTTITSTWANTTLDDIGTALTDSLDRAGSGGMTGQLKLANGAIGAPGLSWATETTSGLYRAGAGDFRYSVGSNDKFGVTAGFFTISTNVQAALPDATAAAPALTFTSDPDTGIFHSAANDLGISAGGTVRFNVASAAVTSGVTHLIQDGAAATPGLAFASDTNTGIFRNGADILELVTGGIGQIQITTAQVHPRLPVQVLDGSLGSPTYSWVLDTNTGFYRSGADQISAVAGGVATIIMTTGGIYNLTGSANAPPYSFQGDGGLGMYRVGANDLGFATNGVARVNINSSGTLLYGGREVGYRGANINNQSGTTYTFVQDDGGRIVASNNTGAVTVTVPSLAAGTLLTIYCGSTTNNLTLAQSGVTLYLSGTTTTGNRTVGIRGVVTLWYSDAVNVICTGSALS